MTTGSPVLEVTDATFAAEVLEKSKEVPVVVDFWAPWCGPCRMLGPIIERVAGEHGGDVRLVKVNTDENPRVAMQYRIQSIPAVKAFRNGQVVREFLGAQPEPQVRAFFGALVPSEAERAAKEAQRIAETNPAAAEQAFRSVLASDRGNVDAIVGLAGILIARGEAEEADDLLAGAPTERRAKVLRHRIFLEGFARNHAGEDLAAEASKNPTDPRARYRCGVLLAAQGDYQEALDELLESVRLNKTFAEGAARKAVLAVFDILGLDSEVVRDAQRRLQMLLF